jgi:ubiquinone/menaquinone biosynthesis C-methylase UbiE
VRNLGLLRGSADAPPFADCSFDLAISINTFHHLALERCNQAIGEIERVSSADKYIQVDSWLTEL